MKKNVVILIVSIVMISAMLCSCAKTPQTAKPSAAATTAVQPSEDASGQGESNDSSLSIVGRWSNEESDVTTEFFEDGTYKTEQGGDTILSDTYTSEVVDSNTLLLKTGQGDSLEIVFIDEYTIQSEGATMVRVTQNESIPENEDSGSSLESLIIGIWVSADGAMEFDASGTLTVVESNNEDVSSYPYTIVAIDDSTIEITITDFDGTTSTETAYFEDTATLIMGDTTFIREID